MNRLSLLTLALAAGACALLPARAASARQWPWGSGRHPVTAEISRGAERPGRRTQLRAPAPFNLALELWRLLLTRVDGPRCQHHPSCSSYAGQALARHRLLPGMLMVLDRLWRGARSSGQRLLPLRRDRWIDPLSEAEFWRPDYLPMSGR